MTRISAVFVLALLSAFPAAADEKAPLPSFLYKAARSHEIKPHRSIFPMAGVAFPSHGLSLTLTVSPAGEVLDAKATGDDDMLKFWPKLKPEVMAWKFTPFEKDGQAVTASVEEYIELVPPGRIPTRHVAPPVLRPDSNVVIALQRGACYGRCPAYTLTVSTRSVVFEGRAYVVALGRHVGQIEAGDVRRLAGKFVDADFYSMDDAYSAAVTDMPGFVISISIDGRTKRIQDYGGRWTGMPEIISELEEDVDDLGHSRPWIDGGPGLVQTLKMENFDLHSFAAQIILKAAAGGGQADTVRELLDAGVPLAPLPAPAANDRSGDLPFENVGWLNAADADSKVLQILMDAGASRNDQRDKDLALLDTAGAGDLATLRSLIAYGADPDGDLTVVQETGRRTAESGGGAGSVLIGAATSGNPEVLREILRFHPHLERRDRGGLTALFAAGELRAAGEDGARVECVRLLVEAGAEINARDRNGNTPLHRAVAHIAEELLKLGADVNARNNEGETPIFTTYDTDAIQLFVAHGADLTIRNRKGQTVMEAARMDGPEREEALRTAMQKSH